MVLYLDNDEGFLQNKVAKYIIRWRKYIPNSAEAVNFRRSSVDAYDSKETAPVGQQPLLKKSFHPHRLAFQITYPTPWQIQSLQENVDKCNEFMKETRRTSSSCFKDFE
ncbi:hypothetical protein SDJN02_12180, partial [Cucurbita argyrosperma subsp. argyrosperma]